MRHAGREALEVIALAMIREDGPAVIASLGELRSRDTKYNRRRTRSRRSAPRLKFRPMDVFISWSGNHSRQVAGALKDWLPAVLQRVTPFVSDEDIYSGARWQAEITNRLDECSFGIVCVTGDNQESPWLQFEAGAISKSVKDGRVVPLLVELKKSDLLMPLSMFQAETLDQSGIRSLLISLNAATDEPLEGHIVNSLADTWWPCLEERVTTINQGVRAPTESASPQRTDRDLLEELLLSVRALSNRPVESGPREVDFLLHKLTSMLQGTRATAKLKVKVDPDTGHEGIQISDYEGIPQHLRVLINDEARVHGVRVTYAKIMRKRKPPRQVLDPNSNSTE